MSADPHGETKRKQLSMLVGLSVALAMMGAMLALRLGRIDMTPDMTKTALAVVLLLPMIVMGVMGWNTQKDLGELELRIQTDAAYITQNVTLVAITVLLAGSTLFRDAFPMPDFSTLALAYIWLVLAAGWFSKRRYA
jgi:hypothetical protein